MICLRTSSLIQVECGAPDLGWSYVRQSRLEFEFDCREMER